MKPHLVGLCPPCNKSGKRTYERFLRNRVLIPPVTSVEIPNMTTDIVLKKLILSLKMFGRIQYREEDSESNA